MSFKNHEELASYCYSIQNEDKEWFNLMRDRNCTSFYCRSSTGAGKVHYFRCNRSGPSDVHGESRLRRSKKQHAYCPAFLNMWKNDDGTINVKACFGHLGHDINPALLRWSEEQEEFLKLMIEDKFKPLKFRESKLFYTTSQDLNNVMRKFNLCPGLRDKDDLTSLSIRASENNPEDGIRSLRMPTGSSRRHFAMAFLLSGTMTSRDVKIVFDEIKKLFPNFSSKFVLSDEALAFFDGSKASFPKSRAILLFCKFHMLQTWNRNAKTYVKGTLLKRLGIAFSKLLRAQQEAAFQSRMTAPLTFLTNSGGLQIVDYLRREYLGPDKIKRWAGFHRPGVVMNKSMYGERWHHRMEKERNTNDRMDYLVGLLICAIRELEVSLEIGNYAIVNNVVKRLIYKENDALLGHLLQIAEMMRCLTISCLPYTLPKPGQPKLRLQEKRRIALQEI
ncbi:hypothetical protein ANCCAN_12847 [Ancylostoma caninum]|uniref:MULE transposase domain-containing protein n=1 Tax=Ancylostoma caninum TaxID=29170 RepID=A0A368GD71_ANCCA|nr:hypothetical protein ANCCAN_12847 [Ancylostoma caninum]